MRLVLHSVEIVRDWCTLYPGQLGARSALQKCCAFKGEKKKMFGVCAVPFFRHSELSGEPTEKGGEGENNAIFLVIIFNISSGF